MILTVSFIVHEDFTHIAQALRSFYTTNSPPGEVYVTINSGYDAQVDQLRVEFPDIQILVNTTPQGFAANHNHIMRLAETEYVALLNDDIILHDGALAKMVNYLQSNSQAGLVGAALQNPDGSPQVSVYSDPELLRALYKISGLAVITHQQSVVRRWMIKVGVGRLLKVESLRTQTTARPVPTVKGVAMVVRQAAYREVGLMDETTLAYGEEADWHLRLRQAGWQVVHVPEAKVTHFGLGQARLQLRGPLIVEDRKAILNYFLKHRPQWQVVVLRVAIVFSHLFWSLVWLPFSRSHASNHYQVAHMGLTWQRASSGREHRG